MRVPLLSGDTLTEGLARAVEGAPEAVAAFPSAGDEVRMRELADASARCARGCVESGVGPENVVGVLVDTAARFLTAIFGVWRAGAAISVLPVQAGFGRTDRVVQRVSKIIEAAGMRYVILDESHAALGEQLSGLLPDLRLLFVERLAGSSGAARTPPAVDPESLAVVQYTSGSTSAPKGVMLTHRTVMAGLRACVVSGGFSPDDVFVQWVPTFHDMGLIGLLSHWLNGADVHVFTPTAFLRRPLQFLEYFSEHRGTVMTGPNFSYDYLLDAVPPQRLATLDLSSWRLAFNGAEPVGAATVRRFAEALAPSGVDASVMYPVYGMAEATLAISFPAPGTTPKVLPVDRDRLAGGSVREVAGGSARAAYAVSVGRAVHGMDLRIVDGAGTPEPHGRLGGIQIKGDSVTSGYFRDVEATRRLFTGDGWLRTGDLGFSLHGDLYVMGRDKEMIVVYGQNFFPSDVEEIAREAPGVYRKRCVAFPDVDDEGRECMGVIVETAGSAESSELRDEVARRVAADLGLSCVRVHLVGPRWLTRTTSGKWQRTLAAKRISAGF